MMRLIKRKLKKYRYNIKLFQFKKLQILEFNGVKMSNASAFYDWSQNYAFILENSKSSRIFEYL